MRGMFGGMVSGGLVSALAISVVSVYSGQAGGVTPPAQSWGETPEIDEIPFVAAASVRATSPVGSVSVQELQTPELPEAVGGPQEPESPIVIDLETSAPRPDTAPLDEPEVVTIEASLNAPQISELVVNTGQAFDPVVSNPHASAPQTPQVETDLSVSTVSAAPLPAAPQPTAPLIVTEAEPEAAPVIPEVILVRDDETEISTVTGEGVQTPVVADVAIADEQEETFVVDLDVDLNTEPYIEPEDIANTAPHVMTVDVPETQVAQLVEPAEDNSSIVHQDDADLVVPVVEITPSVPEIEEVATAEVSLEDESESVAGDNLTDTQENVAVLAQNVNDDAAETPPSTRFQLQGEENSLLGDRGNGNLIRRFGAEEETAQIVEDETEVAPSDGPMNALVDYSADAGDIAGQSLISVILIDDGTMPTALETLTGLPFPVTVALDPSVDDVEGLLETYRAAEFEVVVISKLPEGALPTDVEITFQSVFRSLPETIGLLDLGEGGLPSNRDAAVQAMDILSSEGRGYINLSQGFSAASRIAETAGVPVVEVYRDLDSDDQDARAVGRIIDQAAFRARQESGVVLLGHVRPETISALTVWGRESENDQLTITPVSAILNQ